MSRKKEEGKADKERKYTEKEYQQEANKRKQGKKYEAILRDTRKNRKIRRYSRKIQRK